MDSVIQAITDWLREMLVSGIMGNLTNTFDSVNAQVGQIASDVGQTPSNFSPAIFNMIRNLSENVIMPIMDVDPKTISNLENAVTGLSSNMVRKYMEVFHCDANSLFCITKESVHT